MRAVLAQGVATCRSGGSAPSVLPVRQRAVPDHQRAADPYGSRTGTRPDRRRAAIDLRRAGPVRAATPPPYGQQPPQPGLRRPKGRYSESYGSQPRRTASREWRPGQQGTPPSSPASQATRQQRTGCRPGPRQRHTRRRGASFPISTVFWSRPLTVLSTRNAARASTVTPRRLTSRPVLDHSGGGLGLSSSRGPDPRPRSGG